MNITCAYCGSVLPPASSLEYYEIEGKGYCRDLCAKAVLDQLDADEAEEAWIFGGVPTTPAQWRIHDINEGLR